MIVRRFRGKFEEANTKPSSGRYVDCSGQIGMYEDGQISWGPLKGGYMGFHGSVEMVRRLQLISSHLFFSYRFVTVRREWRDRVCHSPVMLTQ